MEVTPPLQVSSQQKKDLLSLEEDFIADTVSVQDICGRVAQVLGAPSCSDALISALTNWIEASSESYAEGEGRKPFPTEIVVVNTVGATGQTRQKGPAGPVGKSSAKAGQSPKRASEDVATGPTKRIKNTTGPGKGKRQENVAAERPHTRSQSKGTQKNQAGSGKGGKGGKGGKREGAREGGGNQGGGNRGEEGQQGSVDEIWDPEAPFTDEEEDDGSGEPENEGEEGEDDPGHVVPGTRYNEGIELVDGVRLGASEEHPQAENRVRFSGDNSYKKGQLVRTATNFRFVNKKTGGDMVMLPTMNQPVYLIGICGAIDINSESGQRLGAGWWNPHPDPRKRKWRAAAEIMWLKVSVKAIKVEEVMFRGEATSLVVVISSEALYILQSPHADYFGRWSVCKSQFGEGLEFPDVNILGKRPKWFKPRWWNTLVEDYRAFRDIAGDESEPEPPTGIERKCYLAELDLAKAKAELAHVTNLDIRDLKKIKEAQDFQTKGRRSGPAVEARMQEVESLQEQIAARGGIRELNRKTVEDCAEALKEIRAKCRKALGQVPASDTPQGKGSASRAAAPPNSTPPTPTPPPPPSPHTDPNSPSAEFKERTPTSPEIPPNLLAGGSQSLNRPPSPQSPDTQAGGNNRLDSDDLDFGARSDTPRSLSQDRTPKFARQEAHPSYPCNQAGDGSSHNTNRVGGGSALFGGTVMFKFGK